MLTSGVSSNALAAGIVAETVTRSMSLKFRPVPTPASTKFSSGMKVRNARLEAWV